MSWQRNVNEVTMPKFPPPPRSAQNRSLWELALAVTKRAVGEHDVSGKQVVDGEAEAPGQVADAAAQRQPGHAGGREKAGRGGHAERHGRVVDISPGTSGVGADGVVLRADRGAAQQRQVDDQGVVRDPETGRAVTAAPDGELDAMVTAETTQVITSATSRQRAMAAGRLSIMPL